MRNVRTVALVLLFGLIASACGARLPSNERRQAAAAILNAGGSGGTGTTNTELPGPTGSVPTTGPGGVVGGGTKGTQGTQGSQGSQGTQGTGSTNGASGGCKATSTDAGLTSSQVVIGNVSSTTGPVSGLFEGAVQGIQAWAAYMNSQGGLCGHTVKVSFQDDSTNCTNNQNATQELGSKVFAFVGSFSLYDGCGAQYFQQHSDVPDVHVALDPKAGAPKNHFDIETGHLGYATGMMEYYTKKFGDAVKHVGTMYANVGGAVPKQHAFVAAAQKAGWHFVYSRGNDATESDWTSDFVKMCQQQHIKIFFTSSTNAANAAKMVNDEDQAGCPKDLINIIPIAYDQAFLQDVGNSPRLEGLLGWNEYSLFFNPDEAAKIPELKLFQTWFQKAYPGKPANLYALFAWCSGRLFQKAFEAAAPNVSRATLMAQLRTVKNWTTNGAMAPFTPTDKSGGVTCYVLWKVHGGRFGRIDDPATSYRCDGQFVTVNG
jgi:ABC-type branched-subunit amino acid transport system substrate-binding protein